MATIVTHPGPAHRDEFLSCCLLIAAGEFHRHRDNPLVPLYNRIERRDPTAADMYESDVLVLDQGEVHDPSLLNFDHHQFDRDADPACSITLVLPYLGIDVEQARKIWGWLEFSELLDSKGPFATAEKLGSNPDALFAGVSPIETTVLRWFGEIETLLSPECSVLGYESANAPLYVLMERIGREKLNYLNEVVERHQRLDAEAASYRAGNLIDRQGSRLAVNVVDATCIDRDDDPAMGLEEWVEAFEDKDRERFEAERPSDEGYTYRGVQVTITQDDRGDGLCLFRRNDDYEIDFSALEGVEGVKFAHKGGFVAKLEAGVDPLPMINKAYTGVDQ